MDFATKLSRFEGVLFGGECMLLERGLLCGKLSLFGSTLAAIPFGLLPSDTLPLLF